MDNKVHPPVTKISRIYRQKRTKNKTLALSLGFRLFTRGLLPGPPPYAPVI